MQLILQNLIGGLQMGSIYALIALGYTMVYGIGKLINFQEGSSNAHFSQYCHGALYRTAQSNRT